MSSKRIGNFSMKTALLALACGLALVRLVPPLHAGPAEPTPEIPVRGQVTMVDIGGDGCLPCKMMLPIMRELEEKYRGKAAIVSIDVGMNRERIKLYNARVIPTQIFYDREGREISRHEGYLDKKSIIEMLEKMGVQQ